MDTPISANGKVGKPVPIARFFLATDPDATVTPTGVAARVLGHPGTSALINDPATAASRPDGDELPVFRAAGG